MQLLFNLPPFMDEKMPVPKKITNHISTSFIVLLVMIHAVLGLWWLAGWWLFVLGVFVVLVSKHPLLVAFKKKSLVIYPLIFPGVFFLAISFRVLVYGVFSIPSSSMERTILPGDIVWGNKLTYGPALPGSPYEIPWVNLLTWMVEGSRADLERTWWEPKRLRGYREAAPGDIVVFEDPVGDGVMIKRCMGTPGDTIRIVNGVVYINNRLHRENKGLLLYSRVSVSNRQNAIKGLDSLGINNPSFFSPASGTDHFSLYLTLEEADKASLLPWVTSVAIEKERPDTAWRVYPGHESFNWNIDNYGPIVLPAEGMKMVLTAETWILYGRLINLFENAEIKYDRGQFFMEGNQVTDYTFRKNYYFMLGDNRHDSRDSRYYGPVPGDKIICRATMILFSKNRSTPRLSRIFKKLR